HVHLGAGLLDDAEGPDDGHRLLLPADREVPERRVLFRSPVAVGRHFQRAEAVRFRASLAHGFLRPDGFPCGYIGARTHVQRVCRPGMRPLPCPWWRQHFSNLFFSCKNNMLMRFSRVGPRGPNHSGRRGFSLRADVDRRFAVAQSKGYSRRTTMDELTIQPGYMQSLILKMRGLMAQEDLTMPDTGSN